MVQIITAKWWGWGWNITKYVADAPYECWEWEDRAIAWDAVYTKVSAMECVLNTALQPNDNISELCNNAWYIDSSALAPYAKSCDLCTVATSWKYCDLSWLPTIPTDNCQLANWCGYTTCTGTVVASDLTPYAKSCDLCTVATTGKYCDLTWQPTIWNATLTIQRNGTCVNSITMNATSNVTANISVPTKTSDISNDCWYINKDVSNLTNYTPSASLCAVATSGKYCDLSWTPDLSGYQTKDCMVCSLSWADNSHYPTAKTVADALSCAGAGDMMKSVYDPNNCNADAFNYNNFYNKPAIIDNLCCTSCTDALSANQGKALKDLIDTYVGLWRFLSLWNASTWMPISFPLTTPYTYKTWDWYMVEITGTTNYMPNGSSYSWTASTTVDSVNNVEVRDVYIYDGTDWLFQKNNETQVSFSDIAWVPSDNVCLWTVLNAKADTSSLCTVATSWKYCDLTWTPSLCTVATSGKYCDLTWTPSLCTVATSWKYCDLTWTPTIPTNNCQLANGCGYVNASVNNLSNYTLSSCLCAVATSWEYCDLANVPTIPTCVSQLSNDSWYTTCTWTLTASNISDTVYGSSWDWITTIAPSKNAVYDKIEAVITNIPTNNNQLSNWCWYTTCTGTLTASNISDAALSASWDWDTTNAPSKNAVYDAIWDIETLLANL